MSQEDFNARLQRLGASTEDQLGPPPEIKHHNSKSSGGLLRTLMPRSKGNGLVGMLVLAVLFVGGFMVAGYFYGQAINTQLVGEYADSTPKSGPLSYFAKKPKRQAWTYLPAEPKDWVRVSPLDAKDDVQDAINDVAARWPGGENVLRQHPAFQNVGAYLDDAKRVPTILNGKQPDRNGEVIFLHPTGQVLWVSISYLNEDDAVFSGASPMLRASLLMGAMVEKRRKALVEVVQVGDVYAVNRYYETRNRALIREINWDLLDLNVVQSVGGLTDVGGKRTIMHPFDGPFTTDTTNWSNIEMTVPVGDRALVTLNGLASPQAVMAVLSELDVEVIKHRATQIAPAKGKGSAKLKAF